MTTKDDGGPAFPGNPEENENGVRFNGWAGMNLRDWFAGQALASIASQHSSLDASITAAKAYNFADAMLAARRAES